MNKVSDSELLMLFHEKVEEAENMLNQKYEIIIKLILKKYIPIIKILNISFEDLYNECFALYHNALENYRNKTSASFNTYVSLIIERKVKKTIIKEYKDRKKYSIIYIKDMMDNFNSDNKYAKDPLEILCENENLEEMNNKIAQRLNEKEINIYKLMVNGLSCKDISLALKKDYYSIYRKIRSIRKKVKRELKNF